MLLLIEYLFLFPTAVSLCACRHSNEEYCNCQPRLGLWLNISIVSPNSANTLPRLGLSFLMITEATLSIPYSSNKVDVTIVKRLRYFYVSNQFLNNRPLINCLPSLVEHKNNIVALLTLKNSSTIAMTVALTFLSRGDFTSLRLPMINS